MVIEACSLQPDIDILPHGDQTQIGERVSEACKHFRKDCQTPTTTATGPQDPSRESRSLEMRGYGLLSHDSGVQMNALNPGKFEAPYLRRSD